MDDGDNFILFVFLKIKVKKIVRLMIFRGWLIKMFCVIEKNIDKSYCVDFCKLNWILYSSVIDLVMSEVIMISI